MSGATASRRPCEALLPSFLVGSERLHLTDDYGSGEKKSVPVVTCTWLAIRIVLTIGLFIVRAANLDILCQPQRAKADDPVSKLEIDGRPSKHSEERGPSPRYRNF